MILKSIKLTNFLSYGEDAQRIEMRDLNVIIGPNGSGKSNLIEAIELIHSAPKDLLIPISDGGGIRDWLWKGVSGFPTAKIDAVFNDSKKPTPIRYSLSFTESNQQFIIVDERIEEEHPADNYKTPYIFYKFKDGYGVLNVEGKERRLQHEEIDPVQSIFSQRKDPDQYPELTHLGDALSKILVYREWRFGRYTPPRMPQKTDLPNSFLEPNGRNLGLVLNRLGREPLVKKKILESLRVLYEGIDDYNVQIEGGTAQVFLFEGKNSIPATRLSDGTLHYLCLLAILCHPTPPPLVCIDEPELGLHPDVLSTVGDLIKEASTRCQLIVTTHSDVLVDNMSDQPESVLVAEKANGGSQLRRLDAEQLEPWLKKYRLGELWIRGEIGGTRW